MTNFQTPRGTKDLMPEDMKIRDWLASIVKPVVEVYGFQPVETPAFESFDLLSAKAGEDIKNEIFTFEDKGGRMMGLRFDGTVPVARIVANNPNLSKPIKYYYLSRYWRYDEPQAGRFREFWQLGVELIGSQYYEADTETIACAAACVKALGIKKFNLLLNDRRILDAALKGLNASAVCRIIDKIGKHPESEIRQMLEVEAKEKTDDILNLCSINGEVSTVVEKARGLIGENPGLETLTKISELLEVIGLGRNIKADLSIVRGLDYYTSTVFELKEPSYDLTLIGGGRYDNLIGLYSNQQIPATGWAMGIDRIIEVLKNKELLPKQENTYIAAVIPIDLPEAGFKIADQLRSSGVPTLLDVQRRSLGKALEHAAKCAKYAIIVGERDYSQGIVTIRNLTTGKEWKARANEVTTQIKLSGTENA